MTQKPYVRRCFRCDKIIERPIKGRNGKEYMFCSYACMDDHRIIRQRIKKIEKEVEEFQAKG